MANNHSDLHVFSPLLHITPSPLPVAFVLGSSLSPSFNISMNTTTEGNRSVTDSIMSNSSGAIAGSMILGLVFLLGVPGNLFIIWSILARARQRSITTLLILNLAYADGFLMLLTPFFIVYLIKRSWIFGVTLCKILFYLCCANMYASIFMIMLMSLHRLVAVVWPKRVGALSNRGTVLRMLIGLWILALGLSVPPLIFRMESDTVPEIIVCECKHPKPRYVVLQYCMETVLGFLLPYGVIICSYVCILRRIRKTRFRRCIRSEKLILVIVISFGLFWLPYHIINMVQVTAALFPDASLAKIRLDKIWTSFRALASTVAFVSSCINPVLYTFAAKSYIQREGLAFMARLFEGAGLESTLRIWWSNQTSQDREKETDERESFKYKNSDSTTSVNVNLNIKVVQLKTESENK